MPPEAAAQSRDPTRSAWLDKVRPTAERVVTNLWTPHHRAALLWTSPRSLDRKGRLTAGFEKKESRLRAFDELRGQVLRALSAETPEAAKQLVARSEFAHAIRVAFTKEEAVTCFAEFLVAGDNAWTDGDGGPGVLWICSWRE